MKEMNILGANRFEVYSKTRAGSRAVILRGKDILLSHETNTDVWMIPGGGQEEDETPEACCVREVEEETGYLVRPVRHFLTMNEYYEEYRYITHYYACEVTGRGHRHLTEAEIRRGLTPVWLPLEEAVTLFSRHQDYAAAFEEKRGIYLREYTAICEYLEECPPVRDAMPSSFKT